MQGDVSGVGDLMASAGRDRDGVSRADLGCLVVQLHSALAFENEVDLFGLRVIVGRGRAADGNSRLGQALASNARITVRQKLSDFRTVLGDKCRDSVELLDVHGNSPAGRTHRHTLFPQA